MKIKLAGFSEVDDLSILCEEYLPPDSYRFIRDPTGRLRYEYLEIDCEEDLVMLKLSTNFSELLKPKKD